MAELIEVKLKNLDKVIKETLSRIGIPNKKEKILYPSCYLYEQDGKHYIVHFKKLFMLEREDAYDNMCEEDIERRNAIIYCLKQWGLIEVDESTIEPHNKYVFVLPFKEKKSWQLKHKYNVRTLHNEEPKEE